MVRVNGTLAVLAGAGVSLDSPAHFPVARQIMASIIEAISPDEETARHLELNQVRVGQDYARAGKECQLAGDFIRFELLMDVISQFDRNLSVLDAIAHYQTPNANHYHLAQMAIEGHYIITPNFDDLIERAIIHLGRQPVTLCSDDDFRQAGVLMECGVPVFKLHGSFYRYGGMGKTRVLAKETMEASLTSIMSGKEGFLLPEAKYQVLQKLVGQADALMVAGYSGADDFDIVPSLKSFSPYRIIWIDHDSNVCYENKAEQELSSSTQGEPGGKIQLLADIYGKQPDWVTLYRTRTSDFLAQCGKFQGPLPPGGAALPEEKTFEGHAKRWGRGLDQNQKCLMTAEIYYQLSMIPDAMRMYRRVDRHSPYGAQGVYGLASCFVQLSQFGQAQELLDELGRSAVLGGGVNRLQLRELQAYVMSNTQARTDEVEALFNAVIQESERVHDWHVLKTALNDYALFLREKGKTACAMEAYGRSLQLARQMGDIRQQSYVKVNMAALLGDQGRFLEAEQACRDAYHLCNLFGDFRNMGCIENEMAHLCLMRGRTQEAVDYCTRSIARDECLGNECDSHVNYMLRGQAHFEQNEYQSAAADYRVAEQLFAQSSSKDYLYELYFLEIVLGLVVDGKGDLGREGVARVSRLIADRCPGNPVETMVNRISTALVEYAENPGAYLFWGDLVGALYDSREISLYVAVVYYFLMLGMKPERVGREHIRLAAGFNAELGNKRRSILFQQVVCL